MAADIESQVQKLVKLYTQTINNLIERFVGQADIYNPRFSGMIQQSMRELDRLRYLTKKWGLENFDKVYYKAQADMERWVEQRTGKEVVPRPGFAVVNEQAIEALLTDPDTGFLAATGKAIDSVKDGIWKIQNQAKLLKGHQGAFNETIARVGVLEGRPVAEVRKALMNELLSGAPSSELIWKNKLDKLGSDHILGKLAQLPYVKFQKGPGSMRLDRYCDLLARTKTRQAVTTARRYKLLEIGQEIVRVNNSLPLQDDACALYIGKAFALTERAALGYKIPHVKQLPNGGTPFHPNCTHNETPWFPEYEDPKDAKASFAAVPSWALGHTWAEVQKEYMKRGGIKAASKWNENIKNAQNSGGRIRRGGQPLKFDLPPAETSRKARKIAKDTQMNPDTRSEFEEGAPVTEKWVQKVQDKMQQIGGKVTTPDQAIEVGKVVQARIDKEILERSGGYTAFHAETIAKLDVLDKKIAKVVGPDKNKPLSILQDMKIREINVEKSQLMKDKYDAFAEISKIRRMVTYDTLSKLRPLGSGGLPIVAESVTPEVVEHLSALGRATKRIPSDWLEKTKDIPLQVKTQQDRAYFQKGFGTRPDTIMADSRTKLEGRESTMLHEMMHRMEMNTPELLELQKQYWRRRKFASGEKESTYLGPPYGREEVGIKDKWGSRYIGKDYRSKGAPEDLAAPCYEILSVGSEVIHGTGDPFTLYRVSQDVDFMRFMLGIFTGA